MWQRYATRHDADATSDFRFYAGVQSRISRKKLGAIMSGWVSSTGWNINLASPGPIGNTTPSSGSFTTLNASSNVTLSGGTANAVVYLNGSKVATSGSALVFDGSNLGLGVAPNAWSASYRAIQNGQSAFMSRSAGSDSYLLTNSYYNGTDFIYINTAAASYYWQNAGTHAWLSAPSGTQNNIIMFTQAMTLDANGNLLVGTTTSPSGSQTSGNAVVNGIVSTAGYTVATLPTGMPTGSRAYVTDALTPTSLTAVVGGGAVVVPVFYNGSAWIVG